MSDQPKNIDFCVDYEAMSTEQLEALLTQEFAQDSIDNSQMIDRITDILIEREPEKYKVDVDKAYASFLSDYLNTEPLYEYEEEGGIDYRDESIKTVKQTRTRRRFGFAKVACIAAITAALILVGSMTAYAFGYDLWGNIATWTSETFRFKSGGDSSPSSGEKEVPEVIQEFKELAAENGVPDSVLPGWLPNGYSVVNMRCYDTENRVNLYCSLANGSDLYITLEYVMHYNSKFTSEYQKNEGPPEIYEHDRKEYGIMQNVDDYFAVWIDGNIECSIHGFTSRDELIKVINSI